MKFHNDILWANINIPNAALICLCIIIFLALYFTEFNNIDIFNTYLSFQQAGHTALQIAAYDRHNEAASFLISLRANVETKDTVNHQSILPAPVVLIDSFHCTIGAIDSIAFCGKKRFGQNCSSPNLSRSEH